jgi:hypothetical protein
MRILTVHLSDGKSAKSTFGTLRKIKCRLALQHRRSDWPRTPGHSFGVSGIVKVLFGNLKLFYICYIFGDWKLGLSTPTKTSSIGYMHNKQAIQDCIKPQTLWYLAALFWLPLIFAILVFVVPLSSCFISTMLGHNGSIYRLQSSQEDRVKHNPSPSRSEIVIVVVPKVSLLTSCQFSTDCIHKAQQHHRVHHT